MREPGLIAYDACIINFPQVFCFGAAAREERISRGAGNTSVRSSNVNNERSATETRYLNIQRHECLRVLLFRCR